MVKSIPAPCALGLVLAKLGNALLTCNLDKFDQQAAVPL